MWNRFKLSLQPMHQKQVFLLALFLLQQALHLKSAYLPILCLWLPMAGVSDGAYRTMARAGGAGLAYSEMVSVAGIHFGGEKTWELVEPLSTEPDIAVQLFGSKPDQFKEAAAQISERLGDKLALIDINMACPVPKVVKKGEGSALLDTPELAADLVKACLSEVSVPVTVKIRRGRRQDEEVAPEFVTCSLLKQQLMPLQRRA